jgi:hypothetical protein
MTESDLASALRPIAEAFDALGVHYYLAGSIASSAHGVARASLDADVVAAFTRPTFRRGGSNARHAARD